MLKMTGFRIEGGFHRALRRVLKHCYQTWSPWLVLMTCLTWLPASHAQDHLETYGPPYDFNYIAVYPHTQTALAPALTQDRAIKVAGDALTAQNGNNVTSLEWVQQNGRAVQITVACSLRTKYYPNIITASQAFIRVAYDQDDGGSNCFDDHDLVLIYLSVPGYDVGKNRGGCDCDGGNGHDGAPSPGSVLKGDPINSATGNKFEQVTDYNAPNAWLTFRRLYNSTPADIGGSFGALWRHSFDRSLQIFPTGTINLYRPDGSFAKFNRQADGTWTSTADVSNKLTEQDGTNGQPIGYTVFIAATRQTERYSADGLLLSITDMSGALTTLSYTTTATPATIAPKPNLLMTVSDPNGRTLAFSYDAQARLVSIALPGNKTLNYGYDDAGNLASATYPDNKSNHYLYDEPTLVANAQYTGLLTGTLDEEGARFESTSYSGAQAYALGVTATRSSKHCPQ